MRTVNSADFRLKVLLDGRRKQLGSFAVITIVGLLEEAGDYCRGFVGGFQEFSMGFFPGDFFFGFFWSFFGLA